MMMLALSALSQRATVALAHLFTLLTCGSVFYLWMVAVPPDPSVRQLIALGMYAVFVLALHAVRR